MVTNSWVYIVITMGHNGPLVRFVSLEEDKALEFMKRIDAEKPMFYIQELQ